MKIGILGAGMIGATVGKLWVEAGHEVRFGTRHPAALTALTQELGRRASAGSVAEAIAFGETVLLAVPLGAVPELGRAHASALAGKVVLDATNPYPQRDGKAAHDAKANARGSSGWVATHLPGAQVVKAFNTVYFETLASEAHRKGDRVGIPLAGDDARAVATATKLVADAGFEAVALGTLERGRAVEPGAPVYNTGMSGGDVRRTLGVRS